MKDMIFGGVSLMLFTFLSAIFVHHLSMSWIYEKKKIYKYHVQRKWWEQSRDNFKFCAIKDDMQNLTPTGRMMVYLNKPMSQQLLNVKWSVEVSVNNYNWTDLKTEFFRLVLVVVLYSMIFISFWIVVINQLFVNK